MKFDHDKDHLFECMGIDMERVVELTESASSIINNHYAGEEELWLSKLFERMLNNSNDEKETIVMATLFGAFHAKTIMKK